MRPLHHLSGELVGDAPLIRCGRLRRQVRHEDVQPPHADGAGAVTAVRQVERVVALESRLERFPMLGQVPVEAEDSPNVRP
jgi:hypothetical protein